MLPLTKAGIAVGTAAVGYVGYKIFGPTEKKVDSTRRDNFSVASQLEYYDRETARLGKEGKWPPQGYTNLSVSENKELYKRNNSK